MNGRIPSNKLKLLQEEQHAALDANLAYALSKAVIVSFDCKVYSYDLKKPVNTNVKLLMNANLCMQKPAFDLLRYYEEHFLKKLLYGGN